MSRRGLAPAIWPGYACALGAAVCWALSATLAKGLFTPGLDALAVAQTRSLLGFVCLWPVLFVVRRPLALPERRHLPLLALFGLNFVALHATYYYSISRMPVAVAILVQYLAPLLILLYTRLFRRAPVGRALWAAALLCLGGCALVAGVRGGVSGIHPDGLAAALASAAAYATYILLAEAGGRRLSPWTLLCCGLGFAALFWGFLRPWGSFPFGILLQPVPHPAGGNGLAVPFPNVGAGAAPHPGRPGRHHYHGGARGRGRAGVCPPGGASRRRADGRRRAGGRRHPARAVRGEPRPGASIRPFRGYPARQRLKQPALACGSMGSMGSMGSVGSAFPYSPYCLPRSDA